MLDSDNLRACISKIRLIAFDFDGVFTNNMVYVFEDGHEAVRCSRSDGIGLQKLIKIGLDTIIISTETNPVVSERSKKLKIKCIQSCEDKLATLESIIREKKLVMEQVAFVGNDINDLSCLSRVGLPIVVQDAYPEVIEIASLQTNTKGGEGAVREICDLFYNVLTPGE